MEFFYEIILVGAKGTIGEQVKRHAVLA